VTDEDHGFARMGTARSLVHGGQLISQVVDVVESRSVTLGSTVTLEVGRINVCSFGHQPLGDVLVPARMFETLRGQPPVKKKSAAGLEAGPVNAAERKLACANLRSRCRRSSIGRAAVL
jgi:hypothetical protein